MSINKLHIFSKTCYQINTYNAVGALAVSSAQPPFLTNLLVDGLPLLVFEGDCLF